jgi:hypothetical protein
MTQDEIIKALRKVVEENTHYTTWTVSTPHLVLLVNLAIEKEREACAKLCEEMRIYVGRNNAVTQSSAQDCATAIRARGEK